MFNRDDDRQYGRHCRNDPGSGVIRHDPGDWYLQAIAVTPAARGQGIGQLLFADAHVRAATTWCTNLTLDVDVNNLKAKSLYERMGLAVTATSTRAVLLDNAQVHRMTAPVL